MLGLLSVLNWAMAALCLGAAAVVWVLLGAKDLFFPILVTGLMLVFGAPYAYLGAVIEQGRGRVLQTILAALSLLNFPLGTAYGAFALFVVWGADAAKFDGAARGGLPEPVEPRAPRLPADPGQSPWEAARQLRDEGLSDRELQLELQARGFDDDTVETLMRSMRLIYSHALAKR